MADKPTAEDLDDDLDDEDGAETGNTGEQPPRPEPGHPPPTGEKTATGGEGEGGLVVPAVPLMLLGAQALTVAGAGVWHLAGWPGLAAAAVGAAGGTGWLISRRVQGRRGHRPRRYRSGAGRSPVPRPGRSSGGSRRSRGGSTGGGRAGGGGSRGRRASGAGQRSILPGRGRRSGADRKARARSQATGAPPSFGRTSRTSRTSRAGRRAGGGAGLGGGGAAGARRAAAHRAAGRAAERFGRATERGGRAARAAHRAARKGEGPRVAARAARHAATSATPRGNVARRVLLAATVTVAGAVWAWWWRLLASIPEEARREPAWDFRTVRDFVVRPKDTIGTSTSTGKADTPVDYQQSPLITAAQEFAAALRDYTLDLEAGAMMQLRADMARLPEVLEEISEGWRSLGARITDETPVDKSFGDFFDALGQMQAAMASESEELVPEFDRLHEDLVEHNLVEDPKQKMWNRTD